MRKIYLGDFEIDLPDCGFSYFADDIPKPSQSRREVVFDPYTHSLNALSGLDYKAARDLAVVLYTVYPEGVNTLTVRNGKRALLPSLLKAVGKPFNAIEGPEEVQALVSDILASPLLKRILTTRKNLFTFRAGTRALIRINRAEIGDFDAHVLTYLLIAQTKGHVVLEDLGDYGRDVHTNLLRENRFIGRLQEYKDLEEQKRLLRAVRKVKDVQYKNVLYEDAIELAKYHCSFLPGTDGYSTFLQKATGLILSD